MEENEFLANNLNHQQLLMMRLFKKPFPEEDFEQIRRLLVKLLAEQLDENIEKWEAENNITPEYYEELSKAHFRRTAKS